MSDLTQSKLFDAIDWRLINYTNGNVGHDDTIRAIASDAAHFLGEVVAKTDLREIRWCETHSAANSPLCVSAGYPDTPRIACIFVSAGLYLEGETE